MTIAVCQTISSNPSSSLRRDVEWTVSTTGATCIVLLDHNLNTEDFRSRDLRNIHVRASGRMSSKRKRDNVHPGPSSQTMENLDFHNSVVSLGPLDWRDQRLEKLETRNMLRCHSHYHHHQDQDMTVSSCRLDGKFMKSQNSPSRSRNSGDWLARHQSHTLEY